MMPVLIKKLFLFDAFSVKVMIKEPVLERQS